ncbi:MAG: arsenate reductase ArsC [Betaproteobacteria bacterium]|nr:arsenate reductase ArsC [Betaproteobacteria bacterium]
MQAVRNVLFLCTGNSARSIMAEVMLNHLGAGHFKAWSAGSFPTGVVNPLAIETLQQMGFRTDGVRSKRWDEFAAPGAPQMDFVLTVCDNAAGEVCPVWPGQPVSAHWGVEDPAAVQGSDADRRRAFHDVALTLRRRIELMVALPLGGLDALAIQREVRAIGQQ